MYRDPLTEVEEELAAAREAIGYAETVQERVGELAGMSAGLADHLLYSVKCFQEQIQDVVDELVWLQEAD